MLKDFKFFPLRLVKCVKGRSRCSFNGTKGEGTLWDLMSAGAEHYGLKCEKGEVSADYVARGEDM